jgi:uncharacterized membrane protein YkoI
MKRNIKAASAILALAAISGAYAADKPLTAGKQFAKDATVSEADARATALKAFPGKVIDGELEKGKAGSGLYYSFEIRAHNTTREVWVDSKTGQVLRNAK